MEHFRVYKPLISMVLHTPSDDEVKMEVDCVNVTHLYLTRK